MKCIRRPAFIAPLLVVAVVTLGVFVFAASTAATQGRTEYVTIRWDGRENTHLIRPGGQVEHIREQLKQFSLPRQTDERCFYMNIAINGLAKQGYEVVAALPGEVVLKRLVR